MARSQWIATMNAHTPCLAARPVTVDGSPANAATPPVKRLPPGRRSKRRRRTGDDPVDHGYRGVVPDMRPGQITHKGMPTVDLSDPALADHRWYVLVTGAQKEMVTTLRLERIGCAVLYPCMLDYRRINRYKRAKAKVLLPLAVRYLFVGFPTDPNWLDVLTWPSVTGVVANDGRPHHVPFAAITAFMDRHADKVAPDAHHLMPTHREYEVGDTVEVIDGPFATFRARVLSIFKADASIELDVFGRKQTIRFPLDNLASAGA